MPFDLSVLEETKEQDTPARKGGFDLSVLEVDDEKDDVSDIGDLNALKMQYEDFLSENKEFVDDYRNRHDKTGDYSGVVKNTAASNPIPFLGIKLLGRFMKSDEEKASDELERDKYSELMKRDEEYRKKIDNHPATLNMRKMMLSSLEDSLNETEGMMEERVKSVPVSKLREVQESIFTGGAIPMPVDSEISNLSDAKKMYSEAVDLLKSPSKYDSSNGFVNFMKGAGNTFNDLDFWTFGLTKIARNIDLSKIADKLGSNEKGEDIDKILTTGEQKMLDAFTKLGAAQAERAHDLSLGYQAGQSSAESVKFMAEFLLTKGAAKAASSAAKSALSKWLIKHTAKDGLMRGLGKGAVWGTEAALSTVARTPLMPSTYVNITDRFVGFDDKGNVVSKPMTEAFVDGVTDSVIENVSEMSGAHIAGTLGLAGKQAMRLVPNKAAESVKYFFKKMGNSKLGDMWKSMNNQKVSNFLKDTGYNGIGEEMLEEWYGNALRSVTNDPNALKEFATWDNQLMTFFSFLPMALGGAAVSALSGRNAQGRYEESVSALEKVLREMGKDDEGVRSFMSSLDEYGNGGEAELRGMMNDLSDDKESQEKLFKATADYLYSRSKSKVTNDILQNKGGESGGAQDESGSGEGVEGDDYAGTVRLKDGREVTLQRTSKGMVGWLDDGNVLKVTDDMIAEYLPEESVRESEKNEDVPEERNDKMYLNDKEVGRIEILDEGLARVTDVDGYSVVVDEKEVEGYDENGNRVEGGSGVSVNLVEDEEGNVLKNQADSPLFREGESEKEISSFAQKYGFDENDVKKYSQSMKQGNLGGASYAFANMRRKVRLDNSGKSLGEFTKIFAPIRNEIYEEFGNIDALREEQVRREIEERNVMDAARKRVEEEAEAERKRLEEFEVMSDEQLDNEYFKAIENNDEWRMRDLVNEAARRKGYVSSDEFRMSHRAPSYDEEGYDKSMVDVANNKDDIRESLNEQLRMNRDRNRDESAKAIENALSAIDRGKKPTVTIYRAVPKSLKEGKVRNGDWVTLSESYAKQHGNHALEGDYRIMSEEVPAENLYWDGNDINEWGYDDRSDYRYRNTRNNRKLNDLITRDDNGNVVPLSKRFDSRKSDPRFRFIGEKGAANLDKAEEATTRLDNLGAAREMEKSGKDAKAIKLATGWERGADGKWRYEVQDFGIDAGGLARKGRLWSKLPWGEEFNRLSEKLLDGKELTEDENAKFDELSEKVDEMRKSYEDSDVRYLDDYVKDSDLFVAYPELKQMRVELYSDPKSNTGATYYESQNLIRVNEHALGTEDLRNILVHEVQHAIQASEGFARGGNESTYRKHLDSLKEKHDAWSMIDEFSRKRDELGQDVAQIDVYNALRDEYLSEGFKFGDGFIPSRDAFDKGFNLWVRGYDKEGYEDAYNEYQYLAGKYGLGLDNNKYRELSGEVEARNVQSRLNMTPEERRNSLASETEDVAREDQIFLNDALGVSASMDSSIDGDQRMFDTANGGNGRAQAGIDGLKKASDFIASFLGGKTKQRGVRIDIPERANRLAEQAIGHPIKNHYINGNELSHARNRHGLKGTANNAHSIPLRDKDFALMPYIMASPTRVIKGSTALNGTESVRYEKDLSNGVVIVVEREGKFDTEDMENITMWATKKPATNVTVAPRASHSTSETIVISEADATNIRKNAEDAIRNDVKIEEISSAIDKLSDELNVPVRIVRNVDEIKDKDSDMQGRKRGSKGWYDPKTGEVVVVLPNAKDVGDAQATVLHEIVGHKGIRGLFGDRIGEFTKRVLDAMPEAERKKWVDRYNGNEQLAAEEYVAQFAEGYENPTMWEKIVAIVRELLRDLGIDLKLSDADLKYTLWRGVRRMKDGSYSGDFTQSERSLFREGEKAISDGSVKKIANLMNNLKNQKASVKLTSRLLARYVRGTFDADMIGFMGKRQFDSILKKIDEGVGGHFENISKGAGELLNERRKLAGESIRESDAERRKELNKQVKELDRQIEDVVRGELDSIFKQLADVAVRVELKREKSRFDKLTHLKVEGKNQSGVSVAKKVDEDTKLLIRFIQNHIGEDMTTVIQELSDKESSGKMSRIDEIKMRGALVLQKYFESDNSAAFIDEYNKQKREISGEISELKDKINEEKGKNLPDKGELSRLRKKLKSKQQELKATEEILFENRAAYLDRIRELNDDLKGFIETGRGKFMEWVNEEIERKRTIFDEAMRDMDVRSEKEKVNPLESGKRDRSFWKGIMEKIRKYPLSSAWSFNFLVKHLSKNAMKGEGEFYDRIFRGKDGLFEASTNQWVGLNDFRNRIDEKVKEIFGSNHDYLSLMRNSDKQMKDVVIDYRDKGKKHEYKMVPTYGNALYIVMIDKMPEVAQKLRAHGINEEDVEKLRNALPARYLEFADWIQGELLPELREKYNNTHLRLFGSSMANIENYFPLRVQEGDIQREEDVSKTSDDVLPSSVTGSIINRKPSNTIPDIKGTNAFEVLLEYARDMEHWNAYARVNKDLSAILSNKTFRKMLRSRDRNLPERFKIAAQIAVESYRMKNDPISELVGKAMKGFTAAKINFRFFTALKQVLSAPAFFVYSSESGFKRRVYRYMFPDMWRSNWKWGMENLPLLEKRWKGKMMGNEKLDDGNWINRLNDSKFIKSGMLPNSFVDAMTCVNGARAVYDYKLEKYRKLGMSESEAVRRARIDAEIAYNETQQSAEGAMLSQMQKSRNLVLSGLSVFNNSNFSYFRKMLEGIDELGRDRKSEIASRMRVLMKMGISEEKARKEAEHEIKIANREARANILMFGFTIQVLWALGGSSYSIINSLLTAVGGDDEKEEEEAKSALKKVGKDLGKALLVAPIQGVTGGKLVNEIATGYDTSLGELPGYQDLRKMYSLLQKSIESGEFDTYTAYEVLRMIGEGTTGVDLNTAANMYLAIDDAIQTNGESWIEDVGLFLNVPQSQIKSVAMRKREGETYIEYEKRIRDLYVVYRYLDKNMSPALRSELKNRYHRTPEKRDMRKEREDEKKKIRKEKTKEKERRRYQ